MGSDRSSGIDIPAPVMISTGIKIKEDTEESDVAAAKDQTMQRRRGRNLNFRSDRAQVGFTGLEKKVAAAPVIEGVRIPDDASDYIDHRNGRFINNVFVPNDPVARKSPRLKLPEYRISMSFGEGAKQHSIVEDVDFSQGPSSRDSRSSSSVTQTMAPRSGRLYEENTDLDREGRALPFNFNFDSFYAGREQLQDYLDAMALESRTNEVYVDPADYEVYDRSYQESPQDQYTFQPEGEPQFKSLPDLGNGAGFIQADEQNFEIQEQTYQMCPGCPTFSIPIPIPRQAAEPEVFDPFANGYDSGLEAEEGLIQGITKKIVKTISPAINKARSWLESNDLTKNFVDSEDGALQAFTDRLSSVPGEANLSPLMYATVAAVGLGVATMVSTGLSAFAGRQFPTEYSVIDDRINEALNYNPNDVVCLPRLYCEKLKSNKAVIDQFITTKKVGLWMLDRLYDKDTIHAQEDTSLSSQCHLRECIYSLLS
jgi:hypothetical protein